MSFVRELLLRRRYHVEYENFRSFDRKEKVRKEKTRQIATSNCQYTVANTVRICPKKTYPKSE